MLAMGKRVPDEQNHVHRLQNVRSRHLIGGQEFYLKVKAVAAGL